MLFVEYSSKTWLQVSLHFMFKWLVNTCDETKCEENYVRCGCSDLNRSSLFRAGSPFALSATSSLKPCSHRASALMQVLMLLDQSRTHLNFDTSVSVDANTDTSCEWCN